MIISKIVRIELRNQNKNQTNEMSLTIASLVLRRHLLLVASLLLLIASLLLLRSYKTKETLSLSDEFQNWEIGGIAYDNPVVDSAGELKRILN